MQTSLPELSTTTCGSLQVHTHPDEFLQRRNGRCGGTAGEQPGKQQRLGLPKGVSHLCLSLVPLSLGMTYKLLLSLYILNAKVYNMIWSSMTSC